MSVRYIFNTSGDYVAFLQGNNLFNPNSEWLGFIVNGNEVYQTDGHFIGYLLKDDRIVRNKVAPPKMPLLPPLPPLRPLRPFSPLRRLRMTALPPPYEDVFEGAGDNVTRLVSPLSLVKYNQLEGAILIASDNTYLGKISKNKYDSESISNQYGQYGNKYNALSIFNNYGRYGGQYSQMSPFNPYTQTPPRIEKDGQLLGYLTANKYLQYRIDVSEVVLWLNSG